MKFASVMSMLTPASLASHSPHVPPNLIESYKWMQLQLNGWKLVITTGSQPCKLDQGSFPNGFNAQKAHPTSRAVVHIANPSSTCCVIASPEVVMIGLTSPLRHKEA